MSVINTSTITLVISVVFLLIAAYQVINILLATPVKAKVVGYDEDSHFDTNTGTMIESMLPIYRYTYDGMTKTHRSRIAIWFNWIRKDYNTIYISKSGKVFEKEGVISALIAAVIFFLVG